MEIEQISADHDWNRFVTAREAPVYTRWEWGDICENYGHTRHYIMSHDENEVVGALPLVHIRSRLFDNQLVSMPYCEYGSTIIQEGHKNARVELLDKAVALADDLGVDYVVLRGDNIVNDLDQLGDFRAVERFVTMEVDINRGTDDIWNSFESRFRRGVRKAEKEGVKTRKVTDKEGFQAYYRLFLKTMRGHGTPAHSRRFLRELWKKLSDNVTIYLATYEGKPINGKMMVQWNGRMLYRMGVSDHEYRELNGGSLLMWQAIQNANEQGYLTFDLGRTREGSGVYMYKKSMSPEKVWLKDLVYSPDGEVDLPNPEDDIYERLQDLWRRLPLAVTKHVGPPIRKRISL